MEACTSIEAEFIRVTSIVANKFNPNVMQDEEFQALKKDMQWHGANGIDVILVSPFGCFYPSVEDPADGYVIVDGEHRWTAAKELGWDTIRCEVREIDEEEAKGICYRKNKDRGSIDPFKEAALFKSETEFFTQKEIAEKFLVDQSTVSHRLSLLKLVPEIVKQITMMPRGTITPSHLEPIASLPEGEQKKIKLKNEWSGQGVKSVRDLTEETKRIKDKLEAAEALRNALECAKFSKCPKCGAAAESADYSGLPMVQCSKSPYSSEHCWNLETGEPKYKPVTVHESLDKKKKAELSSIIRSNFTIEQLSEAFFKSILQVLPKLESANSIDIHGFVDGERFTVCFNSGPNDMRISSSYNNNTVSFSVEPKEYRTGQHSKIDIGCYEPKQEDIDQRLAFIDNAFKNIFLPLPEKKAKANAADLPGVKEKNEDVDLEIPCEDCSNNSENGGDCHKENFRANDGEGPAYVCDQKKPLAKEEEVPD